MSATGDPGARHPLCQLTGGERHRQVVTAAAPDENPWDDPLGIGRPLAVEVFCRAMVTGHRPQHLTPAEAAWSQVALTRTAWRLRSVYGMRHGISGFALGADTWWALAVLGCGAKLHAYIPFEEQDKTWPEADRELWAELRRRAHHEVVVGGRAYDVKMLHARNDAMLKATKAGSGVVVALYKPGTPGGTKSAVEKAEKMGLPRLLLDPTARKITREGW